MAESVQDTADTADNAIDPKLIEKANESALGTPREMPQTKLSEIDLKVALPTHDTPAQALDDSVVPEDTPDPVHSTPMMESYALLTRLQGSVHLSTLSHESSSLALEFMSVPTMSEISGIFKVRLESIASAAKSFFSGFSAADTAGPLKLSQNLSKDSSSISRELSSGLFVSLADTPLPTPEGFDSSYCDYAKDLQLSCEFLSDLNEHAKSYQLIVSRLLAEGDSGQHDIPRQFLDEKTMMIHAKRLGSHFKKGSYAAEQPLEKLYANGREVYEIVEHLAVCASDLNKVNHKELQTQIDLICSSLELVAANAKKGLYANLSKGTVGSITQGVYSLAKRVEFYAVARYRFMALEQAVHDGFDLLNKINKSIKIR